MKEFFGIIKRWILWIIISYIFIISFFWIFVFIPQRNQIVKYKTEKNLLEYNYFKIKNSPSFLTSIENTIKIAEDKINNFEWLTFSEDPNLTLFEYLENLSAKDGIEIVSMKNIPDKSELYYFWEVKLKGDFRNFINFIYDIERNKKFLKIEEIEVVSGNEGNDFYNIKIAGIKKVK